MAETKPTSLRFFAHLKWLNGAPLLDGIEPYRRELFTKALDTFGEDGAPVYNMVLAGRGKKNAKTLDLILAGLFVLVVRRSTQGSDGYILANDADQANDDLTLAKKLVACNPVLAREIEPLAKELRLRDGTASLKILPAKDIAGAHGKSAAFIGFDEIHGYRNWQLFEALQPDPTRRDALQWITSYASIYNVPGAPLHDLLQIGKAGRDKRMLFSWYSGDYTTDPAFAELPPEERANPSMGSWVDGAAYLEQQRTRLPVGRFRRLHLNLPGAPQGAAFDQANILACVVTGRRSMPLAADRRSFAFVDMSGGSSDDAVLCICHVEGRVVVIDLVEKQSGKPPFSPRHAVEKFANIIRDYGMRTVTGDNFAGNTFKSDFEAHGITYRSCRRSKSDLYEALEPKLNAKEVELPDLPVMIEQAVCLVWRGQRIDHEPGSHDDWINAVAGAVFVALDRRDADALPIMSGKVFNSAGTVIADGVSALFDRLRPKPEPTSNELLHQANLKQQHLEMRAAIEPHLPPLDEAAIARAAAARQEREANRPPPVLFFGKVFGRR